MRKLHLLAAAALVPLSIGLAQSLFSAMEAEAQNTQCSNRPAGDSSNACANTRFVGAAITASPTAPGGSPTQVQFNNSGVFGGLSEAALTAKIIPFTSSLSGAVPASGGGTLNFLRADGTFQPVSSAGTVTSITASTGITLTPNPIVGSGTVALTVPVTTPNGGTGVVSPATHTLPVNQGASAQTNTGTGTTGQCVNSNGASVDPSFKSGCWVLLNTLTASASASLPDTTSITASFTEYEIVFEQILPATNNVTLEFQVQVGGTFQTGTYLSSNSNANGSAVASQNITTGVLIGATTAIPNTAPGVNGRYLLSNPGQTLTCKMIQGEYSYIATTAILGMSAGCYNGGSGAITGIQLITTSGNITSGVMKIYGRL